MFLFLSVFQSGDIMKKLFARLSVRLCVVYVFYRRPLGQELMNRAGSWGTVSTQKP